MPVPSSLDRAGNGFASVVRLVGEDQWALPTPCDGWTVRELVGHVVAGSRMATALASGGTRNDAIALLGVDHLGDDPVASVESALAAQLEAFSRDDVAASVLHHPAGDMPGAQVLRFRVADLLVHQWDLARALGIDDTLDADLVDEVWEGVSPIVPMRAASGVFGSGPSGDVTADAPAQTRLLAALGRRP